MFDIFMFLLLTTNMTLFIYLLGKFGAKLMAEWSSHADLTVLFTDNHRQTTYTVIIFLQSLRIMYPTKKLLD